ncbi:MAG: peptidoglycan recognition protein family protein [bacterium]
MPTIIDGVLVDAHVEKKTFSGIEKGPLKPINAIIVHQTDTTNAKQAFNSYENGLNGTHYVIDKDGKIYQTARITQMTYHVGKIKSRCYATLTCAPNETKKINSLSMKKTRHGVNV